MLPRRVSRWLLTCCALLVAAGVVYAEREFRVYRSFE